MSTLTSRTVRRARRDGRGPAHVRRRARGRAARPAQPRAAAPADPRDAAANRGPCLRRGASRYTAARRSHRPRRWARSPRDRSRRPTATPRGTANESARPRLCATPTTSAPPCAPDAGPRRDTPRPCRRDRGAPRSGNSPAGFRSWEEARVRPTLPDRATRAYARLLRAPIAPNSAGPPAAPARISRPRTASGPGSLVGDELEQASVGIAEVDAQTSSLRSGPLDRAELDPYSTRFEMRDRVRDRPVVGEAHARPNQLRAEHVSVERIRRGPVR